MDGETVWEKGEERNTGTVCNEWIQGPADFIQHWGNDQDVCFVRESVDVSSWRSRSRDLASLHAI